MRWFTKFVRPARPSRPAPVLRTRLRLTPLDERITPSTLDGDDSDGPTGGTVVLQPNVAVPEIVDFTAEEVNRGWYCLTGKVQGVPNPGGLTVTFGGVPSAAGKTTTTLSDGTFTIMIQVKTDGSDRGTVTARTVANGVQSNLARDIITPTP